MLNSEINAFTRSRRLLLSVGAIFLATVLIGCLVAATTQSQCEGSTRACPAPYLGPDGTPVSDTPYFLHKTLKGDGSITTRLTAMQGQLAYPPNLVPGVGPWAKAGVLIKENTKPGSPYVAMMVTGEHGVRMQYDYVHDIPGKPGKVSADSPRWLRLTRVGHLITGFESVDGKKWGRVGEVDLEGLSSKVEIGLFAASPCFINSVDSACRFSEVTGTFDSIDVQGLDNTNAWKVDHVGATAREADGSEHHPGRYRELPNGFEVTGVGDMAPLGTSGGQIVERSLAGISIALLGIIIMAVAFTARGLASNKIMRLLFLARMLTVGGASFVTGLASAGVALFLGKALMQANGNYVMPASMATELRIVLGVALLSALVGMMSSALGVLIRRRRLAIICMIALVVIPALLTMVPLLPAELMRWLLRVTPAAGLAIQQSIPAYFQVDAAYTPDVGYYPLLPWVGLAVSGGFTAVFVALALWRTK